MTSGAWNAFFGLGISFAVIFGIPCWLIYYLIVGRGKAVRRKFQKIGDVRGQTFEQLRALVGKPQSEVISPNGVRVMVWGHSGYHVALRFKDNVCEGVIREVVS